MGSRGCERVKRRAKGRRMMDEGKRRKEEEWGNQALTRERKEKVEGRSEGGKVYRVLSAREKQTQDIEWASTQDSQLSSIEIDRYTDSRCPFFFSDFPAPRLACMIYISSIICFAFDAVYIFATLNLSRATRTRIRIYRLFFSSTVILFAGEVRTWRIPYTHSKCSDLKVSRRRKKEGKDRWDGEESEGCLSELYK